MTANTFAAIRKLDPIEGELWLPSRDGGMVSSCARFVSAKGFASGGRRREMLTAFDRRPGQGERVMRVADGEDVRSFAWSEDVWMARALLLTERLAKGATVEQAHRRARSAHDLLVWARGRFGHGGEGVAFHERAVRLRRLLAADVAKIKERRIALSALAYTWGDINRK